MIPYSASTNERLNTSQLRFAGLRSLTRRNAFAINAIAQSLFSQSPNQDLELKKQRHKNKGCED